MEKLKTSRDIFLISFFSIVALIFIDSLVYRGAYSYLYLTLAVLLLLVTLVLSIIIYDNQDIIENTTLMDSLTNGKSFELEVNKINYDKAKSKAYAKYMRILNGLD